MSSDVTKKIIGRVEQVSFPELGVGRVHARIDTGAQTTAVWASEVNVVDDVLEVTLFGPGHPEYTGKPVLFDEFARVIVASSNGHTEARYKVRALIEIAGKRIRARLTLTDRSTQTYPVLVGRNVLRGKFIVDVKEGAPLIEAERKRSYKLQQGRTA